MHLVDNDNIWLCGNYGKILKSNDGGRSWIIQQSNTEHHLQDIAAWDANTAIAVGNEGVLLTTTDGGDTWAEMDVPKTGVADKLLRVHTYSGGEAWAVGEYGKILHSDDYGKTWTQKRENEDVILNDIIKLDNDTVIAVGEFGRILISMDNGQNWAEVETQTDNASSLMALDFKDELEGVAVGLDGLILRTFDGGMSWQQSTQQDYEMHEHLMDVVWDNSRKGWVVVGNKGVWLTADESFSSIEAGSFDKVDLSWHTEVESTEQGYFTVGANVGLYDPESKIFTKTGNKLVR
ncbi:YCF48-related protein [Neptuniibacter sp. CAU 1671]|uniref:WD40/YVTN/BNR-like repeat-containing protein n=1 Tax=Neptuniibacter sp. CAU 1671 TaxID=3032593 RepID=UPI0023DC2BB4|nr:YCF48-related protein [Neptuniibacter sp. CAU 1671]MDF2182825.1 YCF48-related protein [Neptuniibacter sp. CAU 1671]